MDPMRTRVTRHASGRVSVLGTAAALCAGCLGEIGAGTAGAGTRDMADAPGGATVAGDVPASQPPVAAPCRAAAAQPGPSPVRRLTRAEYDNTVRDLLGDATAPARKFPQEEVVLGFTNNADGQSVSGLLIEQYESAATDLALAATGNLPKLLGCDPAARGEDACVRAFLPGFGLRAYRRPLAPDEVDRLFAFYAAGKQAWDFRTGVRLMLQAMLQSPNFLYRLETGGATVAGAITKLGGYDMASRLSYLLWSSMPDTALLDAAAAGKLETAAQVQEQARRMLADPRAGQAVTTFVSEWLELEKLAKVEKDATLFPRFTTPIRALLRRETEAFAASLILGGGNLEALLTAAHTFMNKDLAAYYGTSGPKGDAFERVALDGARRAGLVTQGGLMAANAKVNQSSPVARGLFVREHLLCSTPPPPPPNANVSPPAPDPALTTRERFARHRTDPACSSCHLLMDPVGLGFEHFDAAGLWRDSEGGKPIDASGELVSTADANGKFDGAVELGARLGGSSQVRDCMVVQWFRHAYGRSELDGDQCTLAALGAAFAPGKGDFKALLVALTQADPFLYRTKEMPR
jgi:hypothetical protein